VFALISLRLNGVATGRACGKMPFDEKWSNCWLRSSHNLCFRTQCTRYPWDAGHRMTFWESNVSWTSTENCNPVSTWTQIPLFIATVTCFNILMKAAPVQWLSMLIVAAIGYVTINLAPTVGEMTPGSSTVLTAFVCGVAGNLYAYATNSPALVPILAGVFLIVPGGMSVRGVEKWLNDDLNGGLDFGSGMMLVAVSISIGLFASSVIMYRPKLKISNAVFF